MREDHCIEKKNTDIRKKYFGSLDFLKSVKDGTVSQLNSRPLTQNKPK